ncbi:hypothetical protein ACTWP5_00535 [Streptomyces sp. 4N509B]|uniref:hypothetical protein n=1 Tax=Streptomyces sp. 4N509B TaxID=3457413 RepID=UPI003FD4C4BE
MSKHHHPRSGSFSEQESSRNSETQKRARQELRERRVTMAKTHGKTQKATIRHRYRTQ